MMVQYKTASLREAFDDVFKKVGSTYSMLVISKDEKGMWCVQSLNHKWCEVKTPYYEVIWDFVTETPFITTFTE